MTNKTKRLQIAQFIALGGTVCSILGIILESKRMEAGFTIFGIGVFLALAAYVLGGFLTALKMSGKIAKWGWLIGPFPVNLAMVMLSFGFAVVAFICFPILPVRKAYKESLCS